ncbi:RHS repeat-associated core domain-containing protein [Myxococcus sp. SDU36]|uniref:RHS repeat-associated core domain-containing protein n=1 Tax=Myxococcus sp. SDU36 TaxID=2831967 RepID=UPI0025434F2B|nr:RHS repeat-associated core domain-containing protein [Myxococcus sp. SDU36]WIG95739.1 RHS repeat protein [Myxococcus sp. SDU36]
MNGYVQRSGGLYQAPAAVVQVLPQLRVDGKEKALGTRPVGLGVEHTWTVELLLPDGSKRRLENRILAGNMVALGVGAPGNAYSPVLLDVDDPQDGDAPRFLYERAAAYVNAWTAGERELARLLQVVPLHPTASVVLVQNQLELEQTMGVPQRLIWKGLEVDADLRTMTPLELVAGRGRALFRMAGYEGSYQEARVLTEGTQEDAVAAVTVIQRAHAQGMPILSITPNNAPTELPLLAASDEVRRDVEDLIARGWEVRIPQEPLQLRDWTGTGYIARNPLTEEGGYFLSGRLSGGQTIVLPSSWLDATLVEQLAGPDAPQSTDDSSRIANLVKVPATDFQEVEVGSPGAVPLAVYVTTSEGVPVSSAPVTFRPNTQSSRAVPRFAAEGAPGTQVDSITVMTDRTGRARVLVIPDTDIRKWAIEVPVAPTPTIPRPASQLWGLNEVMAQTTNGDVTLLLASPFTVLGKPGPLARIQTEGALRIERTIAGIETNRSMRAKAVDRYDNPLANVSVTWSGDPGTGRFFSPAAVPPGQTQLLSSPNVTPTLTLETPTLGEVTAGYVPGPTPGDYVVTAAAQSPGGPVSASYVVEALLPPVSENRMRYALSLETLGTHFSGVFGGEFPEPLVAQVLRTTENGTSWQPVKGDEPDLASVQVRIRVASESSTLSDQVETPLTESGIGGGIDDDQRVVFWPRYLVRSGRQYIYVNASVIERTERGEQLALVNPGGVVYSFGSEEAKVQVETGVPAGEPVASPCSGASVDDGFAQLSVSNPAGYPIYVRFIEKPDVAGEVLLGEGGLAGRPRLPGDASLIELLPSTLQTVNLPLRPGTHGGEIQVEIHSIRFSISNAITEVVGGGVIRLAPAGSRLLASGGELGAKVILPVRNFESAATPTGTDVVAVTATEKPILVPARLEFCVGDEGDVTVTSGPTMLSRGRLVRNGAGQLEIQAIAGNAPPPELVSQMGVLSLQVPPGDPSGQEVRIDFTPTSTPDKTQTQRLTLKTAVEDAGALPVGHTFVKGVSVVDGHLVKQAEDLRVQGRGPALAFTRSYSNQGFERGPLGRGWTHAYRSFVVPDRRSGEFRYMVVGGEGSGQVFTCAANGQCTAQRGFHGTFRREVAQVGGTSQERLVFRAPGGVEYRYGQVDASISPPRHRLLSVTDTSGHAAILEYGGADIDGDVSRIYEAGNQRFLRLGYVRPPGAPHALLADVELMENPYAPSQVPEDGTATSLGVCVSYSYDLRANLAGVRRLDGSCSQAGAPILREEKYEYVDSFDERLQSNLAAYTDANGNTTRYEYYTQNDTLPGEADFLRFGDKRERVKRVLEPEGAATEFVYALQPNTLPIFGQPVRTYETRVKGPRPDVPETVYRMNPYGAAVQVERPLSGTLVARTRAQWDATHLRKESEEDARGRVTRYRYDAFGNMVERRVETPMLAASGDDAVGTEVVRDAQGQPVPAVVERWAYDASFSIPTCHIDAEGRVTRITLDSAGMDPRTATPTGTGLPLETRTLATAVASSSLLGAAGCLELAETVAPSPQDIVTGQRYCQLPGGTCPSGALRGDVSAVVDGNGNVVSILEYDAFGHAARKRTPTFGGRFIETTYGYDARGRLEDEADTLGHKTHRVFDGLDRMVRNERRNDKGPWLTTEYQYYPGGQVEVETNGLGLTRRLTLDGLNRVKEVTESGGDLTTELRTSYFYDEAGNRTEVVDRRGVVTYTAYDFADRPTKVTVAVRDGARFQAQGGESTQVGLAGVVARYGYDAAGNRVWEEDKHGFRTESRLDSLYRMVGVTTPEVPSESFTTSTQRRYEVTRRYDRVGNLLSETDGNGHTTTYAYDFANRRTSTVDAVGREERREYDGNGNVTRVESRQGAVVHLARTTTYDGLNRPLGVTESVVRSGGATPTTWTYSQASQYDDEQHRAHVRDRRGFVTTVELDDLDRVLTQVVDDGASPLTRNPDDARVGPALGLVTRYEYDANGNRSAVVDALGRRTEEVFDGLNRRTLRRLPMGVTESSTYDGEGHGIAQVDGRGILRKAFFDALGRQTRDVLVESLSAGGQELTRTARAYVDVPEAGLVQVEETDARSHVTRRYLDALGREVRTVDALGHERETRFDFLDKREEKDRKGYVTTYAYDAASRLRFQWDFDLQSTSAVYTQSHEYDDVARTQTLRDRRGVATEVRYMDGLGRVERTVRSDGVDTQTGETRYDASSHPTRVTDANGHVTESVYDGAGRLLEATQGLGTAEAARTTSKYDAVGNVLEVKSARVTGVAYDVRHTYDDLNRAVRSEDSLGQVTTRAFDAAGNKECEKRPLGGATLAHNAASGLDVAAVKSHACAGDFVTRYAYDEEGKLLSVEDALEGVYSFVYDARRNLMAKQDANGNLTTYAYDALNRRTDEYQHLDAHARLTPQQRGSVPGAEGVNTLHWHVGYDDEGNVSSRQDAEGQLTLETHGVLNRLEARTYLSHKQPRELPSVDSEEYEYDANGNVTSVVETKQAAAGLAVETTVRTFDGLDRLKEELRYDGKRVGYGYDAKGNRQRVEDADGVATVYTYDALDRVRTATMGAAITTYTYWPDGLLKGTDYPNGIEERRCYDAVGRLTDVLSAKGAITDACSTPAAVVSRYGYGYDANGNRTSQVEQRTLPATQTLGTSESTTYGYDALDRLVGVKYPDGQATLYRLDDVGNRLGERKAPGSAVASLTAAAFFALAPADVLVDVTTAFDRADRALTQTDAKDATRDVTLAWDNNGNLIARQKQGVTRQLAWDIRNTLTTVYEGGQEVGRYDYDVNLQRTKRRTATENVEYVLDEAFVLQEADGSQAQHPTRRRYHYGKGPLAVSELASTTTTSFLGTDALGSVTDAMSAGGAVTDVRQYDAWGNHRNETAPSAGDFKLGFTGHQYDTETGLTYARARYYDAESGIFISRDSYEGSLDDAPSLHRYAYAFTNPLKWRDVNGHDPWSGDAIIESQMLADGTIGDEQYEVMQEGRGIGAAIGAAVLSGVAIGPAIFHAAMVKLGLAGGGGRSRGGRAGHRWYRDRSYWLLCVPGPFGLSGRVSSGAGSRQRAVESIIGCFACEAVCNWLCGQSRWWRRGDGGGSHARRDSSCRVSRRRNGSDAVPCKQGRPASE